MTSRKVMVTFPEDQLRIIDSLVDEGIAPTRSALIQQIMNAFVSDTRRNIDNGIRDKIVTGALEGFIAYFLYSLKESAISKIFGVE